MTTDELPAARRTCHMVCVVVGVAQAQTSPRWSDDLEQTLSAVGVLESVEIGEWILEEVEGWGRYFTSHSVCAESREGGRQLAA